MSSEIAEHPSYGMLSFSRIQVGGIGEGQALFGSSIKHHNVVEMELKRASVERSLNNDHYYDGETIAKVEMSQSQFAELITSMNMGGVPVTLRYTEKDGYIGDTPFESKQEEFRKEFSEHLEGIKKEVNMVVSNIGELFNSKATIGKRDREEIIKKLQHLAMEIGVNSEYIYEQFNSQMDKTVKEAKGEVEAFVQNRVTSIAKDAISEKQDIQILES